VSEDLSASRSRHERDRADGWGMRGVRAAQSGIAALAALLLLSMVSCSTGSDEPPAEDRSDSQAVDVPVEGDDGVPAKSTADPNDLLADCLLERGLDVRRSGEVDGELNAGVDLSHIDQTDSDARRAIEECSALAEAAARGD
jgi:hypothetical protein